jgi:hypothetical protein
MNKNSKEPFFWVKSGQPQNKLSIHITRLATKALNSEITPDKPRPRRVSNADTKHAGLQTGWTRASFIVREEWLHKIKTLAYWERRGIKDILDEAFSAYLESKRPTLNTATNAAPDENASES